MVSPLDINRLTAAAGVLAKLAATPQGADIAQRIIAGASQGIAQQPDAGPLAGKKTYIVAALGVLSTVVTIVFAMLTAGGLTPAGWCAAIVALVTSGGFATLRSALSGHYGAIAGLVLDVGQQIALAVTSPAAPAVSGAAVGDPAMDRAAGH